MFPDRPIGALGQKVLCDLEEGLVCRNQDQIGIPGGIPMCYNYEINVYCFHLPLYHGVNHTSDYLSNNREDNQHSFTPHGNEARGHHPGEHHFSIPSPPTETKPVVTTLGSTTSGMDTRVSVAAGNSLRSLITQGSFENETWWLCNCTMAVCKHDNTVELVEVECKPPPMPTCSNNLTPVRVMDPDGCCWDWECYCTGWGDPHYVTFDGLYYSYQGNCTYVLVEEVRPTVDNFGVYIDNYHCDVNDQVSCPRTLIVRHETQEVLIKTVQMAPMRVQVQVNKQAVALPYKKYGLQVYESGINYVVNIPELDALISYNGLSFTIRLPYRLFGNNTKGQCERASRLPTPSTPENSTLLVEGCFCPEGTMNYAPGFDVCVEVCGCVGPDNVPREFGEHFEFDCKDCVCLEGGSGIVCQPKKCSQEPPAQCKEDGTYLVTEVNPADTCCNITFCMPKGVCVVGNAEYQPGSPVYSSKCETCVCTNITDSATQLNHVSCSHVPCPSTCNPPGDMKSDPKNNCTFFSCVKIHNQLISSVSNITCPDFDPSACLPGSITLMPNGCCKKCIPRNETKVPCSTISETKEISEGGCTKKVLMNYCSGSCGTFAIYRPPGIQLPPARCLPGEELKHNREPAAEGWAAQSYELKLSEGQVEVIEKGPGQEAPYAIRQVGIYLVVDTVAGLVLLWDKKTSIFLRLSPEFKGRVCGLCGNFDDNAVNDFTTRSQSVVGDALEFGNSWKFSPTWAACAQACHDAGVCVAWRTPDICPLFCDYYNPEGQCEWHYQPCGAPCLRTCRNPRGQCLHSASGSHILELSPWPPGCYPKCPPEAPIFDEDAMRCVATCPPPPCQVQGKSYRPGAVVPSDENCHSCVCTENGVQCAYDAKACVCSYDGRRFRPGDVIYHTTDGTGGCISARCGPNGTIERTRSSVATSAPGPSEVPGVPTTSQPSAISCLRRYCSWTEWLDGSYPKAGINSGDFDTFQNLRSKGYAFCEQPSQVQCRAERYPDTPLAELGQTVVCSDSVGLLCLNKDQLPPICYNYQIRIQCCEWVDMCRERTTPPGTSRAMRSTPQDTTQTQAPWTSTQRWMASSIHVPPATKTIPSTHTVTPRGTTSCQPQCTWTQWFDVDFPYPGPHGGRPSV
ncbi:PREDICTED: mucin-5AC [Myotis davidii]|uniref:mucin-5AC n=1 Tax=Myotis davidii TaxID=225400 RepID=UPI00076723BE|nr:PREDICTED: mucin-5AC [Myotis davidii]